MIAAKGATSTYHNAFEKHHRFIGWLGLAVCTNDIFRATVLTALPR